MPDTLGWTGLSKTQGRCSSSLLLQRKDEVTVVSTQLHNCNYAWEKPQPNPFILNVGNWGVELGEQIASMSLAGTQGPEPLSVSLASHQHPYQSHLLHKNRLGLIFYPQLPLPRPGLGGGGLKKKIHPKQIVPLVAHRIPTLNTYCVFLTYDTVHFLKSRLIPSDSTHSTCEPPPNHTETGQISGHPPSVKHPAPGLLFPRDNDPLP